MERRSQCRRSAHPLAIADARRTRSAHWRSRSSHRDVSAVTDASVAVLRSVLSAIRASSCSCRAVTAESVAVRCSPTPPESGEAGAGVAAGGDCSLRWSAISLASRATAAFAVTSESEASRRPRSARRRVSTAASESARAVSSPASSSTRDSTPCSRASSGARSTGGTSGGGAGGGASVAGGSWRIASTAARSVSSDSWAAWAAATPSRDCRATSTARRASRVASATSCSSWRSRSLTGPAPLPLPEGSCSPSNAGFIVRVFGTMAPGLESAGVAGSEPGHSAPEVPQANCIFP